MPSKLDQTVAYISNLEIGTKVSIKSLAKELAISEGTAYHAIKRAEQQNLVVTLPKAGTTRISPKTRPTCAVLTVSALMDMLDAKILTNLSTADPTLYQFYVGDGSVEELRHFFERNSPGALCILGDRPEMQQAAISCGANLLLTGNAKPQESIVVQANQEQLVILQTEHSSFYVLHRLNTTAQDPFPYPVQVCVREWMQPPQFLYMDDLVADGRNIFKTYGISKIPVVNAERHICGVLNAVKAFDCELSQRISRVYEAEGTYQTVQDTDSMGEATAQLLLGQGNQVFILKDGCLEGMLTANDIIKFCQYHSASVDEYDQEFLLETMADLGEKEKRVYSVRFPFSEWQDGVIRGKRFLLLLLSAANRYCREEGIDGSLLSNTFFATNVPNSSPGDLFLSVEALGDHRGCHTLECELYSDSCTYARCDLLVLSS